MPRMVDVKEGGRGRKLWVPPGLRRGGGSSVTAYRYYRLVIQENGGDTDWLGINTLSLHAEPGGADLVQQMGGTPTAVQPGSTTYPMEAAFDGDPATGWIVAAGYVPDAWIQWDFGEGASAAVAEYHVGAYPTATNTGTRSPRAWLFQGSNDGATWDTLHTVTGETGWMHGEVRTHTVAAAEPEPVTEPSPQPEGGAYRYYRLHITDWNNAAGYLELASLELASDVGGVDIGPTTEGVATASSEYSATYAAANAFDGIGASRWISSTGTPAGGPQWVAYEFATATSIAEYGVRITQTAAAPFTWTFEGSEDGITWDVLDSRTNEALVANETSRYALA